MERLTVVVQNMSTGTSRSWCHWWDSEPENCSVRRCWIRHWHTAGEAVVMVTVWMCDAVERVIDMRSPVATTVQLNARKASHLQFYHTTSCPNLCSSVASVITVTFSILVTSNMAGSHH